MWIQDPVSREIFNSRFAYEYTEHCYPVQNLTADFSEDGSAINVAWEAPETGTPTGYNIYINGVLMEENYTSTSYTNNELATELYNMPKNHYVEVRTMYADDKSSVSLMDIFASGVNVSEINETSSFNVYPNPASDFVKVTTVNGQQSTVKVYNTLGMLVEEIEINSNETEINVSDYNPGIYFFSIQTENGNVTKKIVVE